MANPVNVFLAYAPADKKLAKELALHLNNFERQGLATIWDISRIYPGQNWRNEITTHLDSAQIILLLISPDFLSSQISQETINQAIKKQQKGATVVPILLRPAHWQESPIGSLLALPRNGKPIAKWSIKDLAILEIAQEIKRLLQDPMKQAASSTVLSLKPDLSDEEKVHLQEQLGKAESSLRESYTYMQSYENLIRISSDPAEKDGARRAAERQRILAQHFLRDYRQAASQLGISIPAEIAQMSVYIDDNNEFLASL